MVGEEIKMSSNLFRAKLTVSSNYKRILFGFNPFSGGRRTRDPLGESLSYN
jgi:hypothetical protein